LSKDYPITIKYDPNKKDQAPRTLWFDHHIAPTHRLNHSI